MSLLVSTLTGTIFGDGPTTGMQFSIAAPFSLPLVCPIFLMNTYAPEAKDKTMDEHIKIKNE